METFPECCGKCGSTDFLYRISYPRDSCKNNQNITVTLQEDSQILDEVVVVGYGVAKKSDLTGSISQVKAESMQNYTPSSVGDLLRNSIPGMSVGYLFQRREIVI